MQMRWFLCLICLGLWSLNAHSAAERRVALVIGNAAYADKPLRNSINDATDLAAALKRVGFEVMERKNRTADQLRGDLSDFQDKLSPGAVGLFYFAGHGVQAGRGQNYLLPVGLAYKRERDAEAYGLEVGSVLRRMEDSGAALSLVILDACRDSPLPAEGRSTGSRGLSRMEAHSGSMIAFATAPGNTADDNATGRNGLYTQHLLAAIESPGLRLEDVFKRVRRNVERDSNRRQSPEEVMKLTSDEPFYFKGGPAVQTVSVRPEPTNRPGPRDPEEEAWQVTKASSTAMAFDAYLSEYPGGRYASAARIARVSRQTNPNLSSPPLPTNGIDASQGVPSTEAENLNQYRLSAEKGDAVGQYNLGVFYAYGGGGLVKNEAEAVRWYRKAADQGLPDAQYDLGVSHDKGRGGLVKNEAEAARWYRKAADQGHPHAQFALGAFYVKGQGGLDKDEVEAVRWSRMAADQGHPHAQYVLGVSYELGRGGLGKDEADAMTWFRKAAAQGNSKAQYKLGYAYENGQGGLAKDQVEAVRWYRKAADQGLSASQYALATFYDSGKGGLAKNEAEAVRWYGLAAAQGNTNAQAELRRRLL
jgi:TPR repeat protein